MAYYVTNLITTVCFAPSSLEGQLWVAVYEPVRSCRWETVSYRRNEWATMFRVILPEGELGCDHYEREDNGVTLYNESDEMLAFVPYSNLHAIINDENYDTDERSIM